MGNAGGAPSKRRPLGFPCLGVAVSPHFPRGRLLHVCMWGTRGKRLFRFGGKFPLESGEPWKWALLEIKSGSGKRTGGSSG